MRVSAIMCTCSFTCTGSMCSEGEVLDGFKFVDLVIMNFGK